LCGAAAATASIPGAQGGLWGKPTNINNVETWYNISPIVDPGVRLVHGNRQSEELRHEGISLVGKVSSTRPVEMRWATPLRTFIYDIGEGGANGHQIKAVQTGGPSGGCIPPEMFDTPWTTKAWRNWVRSWAPAAWW